MSVGTYSVGHPVNVATGAVYLRRLDLSIPGRFSLNWLRFYSTAALASPASPLGTGWCTPYFAELTRAGQALVFRHMEGPAGYFAEALSRVRSGETTRDLSASSELSWQAGEYVVCVWDPDSLSVERYRFREAAGDRFVLARVEDVAGIGVNLEYDAERRLTAIRQSLEGRALGISYSGGGLISAVSAWDGQTWRAVVSYAYDGLGRLTHVADASGGSEEYHYDDAGRLTREKTKSGGVFTFRYDGRGRCVHTSGLGRYDEKTLLFKEHIGWTEVTDSLGQISRFHWNGNGQVLHEINAAGEITATEYDEHGRIRARTFAGGRPLSYEYDRFGNRSAITDPLGRSLRFAFNERHQVTALTDPAGNVWTSEYDTAGRWTAYRTPLGSEWRFEYDAPGNLTATRDPRGFRSQMSYPRPGTWELRDYAGNRTSVTENYLGRVDRRVDPGGLVTEYSRDAMGRLVRLTTSEGTDIRYQFDAAGNVVSVRDSVGAVTAFRYGSCRRLLEQTDPLGGTRKFRWGTEPGHLLEITNEKGETHRIEYDGIGRILRETGFSGVTSGYEYDAAGFRAAFIDQQGGRTEYTWDPAGQMLSMTTAEGARYEYAYDARGDLVRAQGPGGVLEFTRDRNGRVMLENQDGIKVEFEYDPAGCVTRIASSTGAELRFGYDAMALPVSARINGQEVWRTRRNNQRMEVERRQPGGLLLQQEFDPSSWLRKQRLTSNSGATLLERNYKYDVAGRLVGTHDSVWGEVRHAYDAAGHIVATTAPSLEERLEYDAAGNLVRTTSGEASTALQWAPGNRLLSANGTQFEYDAAGRPIRMQADGRGGDSLALTWSAPGRLTSIAAGSSLWTYRYDPIGRRLEKQGPEGSVRFVWAGDVLLQERFASGRSRIWAAPPGTFTPVAMLDGEQPFAIISDPVGTPRDVFDSDGRHRWSVLYDTWGAVAAWRGDLPDFPMRFPGQYHDRESGFHYSRFRYYDPLHGRFLSPDPLGLAGGLNEYAYGTNPIGWIDPLGLIIVYRNLRPNEDPSKGLSARQPGRDMAPGGHVNNGSRDNFKGSQYISTTTDPAVAAQWREEGQTTVRFDTDRVVPDSKGNLSIVDISDREKAVKAGLKARTVSYAAASKEVLVEGYVPPDAIEKVPPPEEEEKTC